MESLIYWRVSQTVAVHLSVGGEGVVVWQMIMCKKSVACIAINFIDLVCCFREKYNLIMEIEGKSNRDILL